MWDNGEEAVLSLSVLFCVLKGSVWKKKEEEKRLVLKQLFTEAEGDAGWEEGRGDASEWYAPCCTCRQERSGQGGPSELQPRTCRSASSLCSACKHHSTSDTSLVKMWTEIKKHTKSVTQKKNQNRTKQKTKMIDCLWISHLHSFFISKATHTLLKFEYNPDKTTHCYLLEQWGIQS